MIEHVDLRGQVRGVGQRRKLVAEVAASDARSGRDSQIRFQRRGIPMRTTPTVPMDPQLVPVRVEKTMGMTKQIK